MDLPIYKATISDNDSDDIEVEYIALVDRPAIKKNWIAFNNQELKFSVTNEEERIVTGPAMIANLPLYRNIKGMGEFYSFFDAPTIKQIALRFFRKGYNKNLNIMHKSNAIAEDCYVFESWIVEPDKGKTAMGFSDIEPGSWFISVKVDNDDIWKDVKDGKFMGFSVEGFFKLERQNKTTSEEEYTEEFLNELKKILQRHKP